MAADPDSFFTAEKVIAAVVAVVTPIWGARTWLEKRFARKLEKDDFKDFIKRFDEHVRNDREVQAKLFDKIDEVKTILIERR